MSSNTLLDLDPKLIFDLAARVDPPRVIAERYGLDPQYLLEVLEIPHVRRMVQAKKRELDQSGFALAAKARLMFEDLLPDVYRRAKAEGVTLSGVLEAAKFMRTVAGMDKQEGSTPGEKFSITIKFSGDTAPKDVVVSAERVETIDNPPPYIPRVEGNALEYTADEGR